MKPKNTLFTVILVLFLTTMLLAASTVSPRITGDSGSPEAYQFRQLRKTALQKGLVRVIIRLQVPHLEALTARSTSYKTGNKNTDIQFIQSAANADGQLKAAITHARETVFHQLGNSPYNVTGILSTLPYVGVSVPAQTLDKIKRICGIENIMEDKLLFLPDVPETDNPPDSPETRDTSIFDLPQLEKSTRVTGADIAWQQGATGAGWYVAVIDTGIRRNHEMFRNKIIVEACFASDLQGNGKCPNKQTIMFGPGSAEHDYSVSRIDSFDHGSHVSGIALGNNGSNRLGMAKDANLIALQTFSYFPEYYAVVSWYMDQIRALDYLYTIRNDYNIAAANMSLGGGSHYSACDTDPRKAAIDNLRAAGIATVISSGNAGDCNAVSTPGCIDSAITVNATTKEDTEYTFGNWHDDLVDLMAPGVHIDSAVALSDFSYGSSTGTSMAAPHVAGAWAIIKSVNQNLSIDEILELLHTTGVMIYSTRCPDRTYKARIDVGQAVTALLRVAPPLNPSAQQVINQSLLQTEYINVVTWQSNPFNADKNVTHYNIYRMQGDQQEFVAQVDGSTFTYHHRKAQKDAKVTYAITAVDDKDQESAPAYYTLTFPQNSAGD